MLDKKILNYEVLGNKKFETKVFEPLNDIALDFLLDFLFDCLGGLLFNIPSLTLILIWIA